MYPPKLIFNLLLTFSMVNFQQDFILNFLDVSNIIKNGIKESNII